MDWGSTFLILCDNKKKFPKHLWPWKKRTRHARLNSLAAQLANCTHQSMLVQFNKPVTVPLTSLSESHTRTHAHTQRHAKSSLESNKPGCSMDILSWRSEGKNTAYTQTALCCFNTEAKQSSSDTRAMWETETHWTTDFERRNLSSGHALPVASTTFSPILSRRRDTERKPELAQSHQNTHRHLEL